MISWQRLYTIEKYLIFQHFFMYKVLIIEDDLQLALTIKDFLDKDKYTVKIITDGSHGYKAARNFNFDLVVLDIMLPRRDGFSIAGQLRAEQIDTPILMLTNKKEVDHIVTGFNSGTDAYLAKPFNLRELMCRIEGLLNRPPSQKKTLLQAGRLSLNLNTYQVYFGNKQVNLRHKELEILKYLMRKRNKIVTREQILNNVWEFDKEPFISTVDAHISNIRSKISSEFGHKILKTVHGEGYKLIGV